MNKSSEMAISSYGIAITMLQLSGTANISGMPQPFSYTQNADKDVDIKAKFLPSTVFTAQIRQFYLQQFRARWGQLSSLAGILEQEL